MNPPAGPSSPKKILLALPGDSSGLRDALDRLSRGRKLVLGGLVPAAKALYLLHLQAGLGRHLVLVGPDEERASELLRHLRALAALVLPQRRRRIFSFPELGANPYQVFTIPACLGGTPGGLAIEVTHIGHQLAPLAGQKVHDVDVLGRPFDKGRSR